MATHLSFKPVIDVKSHLLHAVMNQMVGTKHIFQMETDIYIGLKTIDLNFKDPEIKDFEIEDSKIDY